MASEQMKTQINDSLYSYISVYQFKQQGLVLRKSYQKFIFKQKHHFIRKKKIYEMMVGIRRHFMCHKLKKIYSKSSIMLISRQFLFEKLPLKDNNVKIYIDECTGKKSPTIILGEMHRFAFEGIIFADEIYQMIKIGRYTLLPIKNSIKFGSGNSISWMGKINPVLKDFSLFSYPVAKKILCNNIYSLSWP